MLPWLIVAGDFRPGGGMDHANYQLAWHLAERLGREVHLVAHHVAAPLACHPRARLHLVQRPLGVHALGGVLLDRAGRKVARQLCRAEPRTRVVVNGGNCRWPGINWVHMVHHACGRADAGAPWLYRLKNWISRGSALARERQALAVSPLVIANSHKTRRELVDLLGLPADRVRVVYLACDTERFQPFTAHERESTRASLGISSDGPVALFVGALSHDRNKGFDTLLRAWRLLSNGRAFGQLLAAGAGALAYWKRQVDTLGLSGQVRLLGHTAEIHTLFAAADLLVSPTRYDAYGLAVHEALCCGLPAIVSRAAGVAERYPPELRDLLLSDPEDAADLARRMSRCRDDLAGYRAGVASFGAALRSRSWEDVAAEIVDLVEQGGLHPGRRLAEATCR
jgi:glycosyltransferase involved in cell wall biosynthesis